MGINPSGTSEALEENGLMTLDGANEKFNALILGEGLKGIELKALSQYNVTLHK